MNNLKVAICSIDIAWCDVDENLFTVTKAVESLDDDTDLVVLPELFSTGYIDKSESLFEMAEYWEDSTTLRTLKELSKRRRMALCGSLMIKATEGRVLNRGVLVEPSGEVTFYDKHHLFSLSHEASLFEAGTLPIPVVRYRGWNIAMAVCYDLRFPTWLRNHGAKYDVLIIPANWPQARAYAWQHLLMGRAIENQAYVIGANRSGHDDYGEYDGLSFIYDCLGRSIGTSSPDSPKIVTATLSHDAMVKLRKHFPVLNDAD